MVRNTFGPGHSVSKEIRHDDALSIGTRDDDPEWSDMVNWMVQSLLEAEKRGIGKKTAKNFPSTSVFGKEYRHIFQKVVAAIGNYGDLYARHLESILPRSGSNLINTNRTSGLLRVDSLHGVSDIGPDAAPGG